MQRFCVRLLLEGPLPRTLRRARSPCASVRVPPARQVASLFLQRAEIRTAEQACYLERLPRLDPTVTAAFMFAQDFLTIVQERQSRRPDRWIAAVSEQGRPSRGDLQLGSATTVPPSRLV